MHRINIGLKIFLLALVGSLFLTAQAFGADGDPSTGYVSTELQLWTLVAGSLATVVAYVLNRVGPQVSQTVKGLVTALTAAAAAALSQAIDGGTVGFNHATGQLVLSAIVAAFIAHSQIWKPTGVQAKLAQPEVQPGEPSVPRGVGR